MDATSSPPATPVPDLAGSDDQRPDLPEPDHPAKSPPCLGLAGVCQGAAVAYSGRLRHLPRLGSDPDKDDTSSGRERRRGPASPRGPSSPARVFAPQPNPRAARL